MVFSIFLFFIVYYLSITLLQYGEELHKQCPLPENLCPIKRGSLPSESILAFSLIAIIFFIGLYLTLFFKQSLYLSASQESKDLEKFKEISKTLQNDEKKVYDLILEAGGSIFQSELVSKTGFSKVKITRILDRLETRGLIERKRRGMTNLVALKG